jgi:Flp pilus assembly pilin Flp
MQEKIMHIKLKNKRGQSTVEYVLLVTAVLAVIIAFTSKSNGPLQTQLNSTLGNAVSDIGDEGTALDSSHALTNSSGGGTSPWQFNVVP